MAIISPIAKDTMLKGIVIFAPAIAMGSIASEMISMALSIFYPLFRYVFSKVF